MSEGNLFRSLLGLIVLLVVFSLLTDYEPETSSVTDSSVSAETSDSVIINASDESTVIVNQNIYNMESSSLDESEVTVDTSVQTDKSARSHYILDIIKTDLWELMWAVIVVIVVLGILWLGLVIALKIVSLLMGL